MLRCLSLRQLKIKNKINKQKKIRYKIQILKLNVYQEFSRELQ